MTALDDLQCHFTWITDEELQDRDLSKTLHNLVKNQDYEGIEMMKQSFVAFLRTQGPHADLEGALRDAEEAILICQNPAMDKDILRRCGFELIALSNKAHIQHMLKDDPGKEETLERIRKLTEIHLPKSKENEEANGEDDRRARGLRKKSTDGKAVPSSEKMEERERKREMFQACNAGARAFSLNELALNQESLVLFRTAEKLDPDYYHWPMGRGVTAGRVQRRLFKSNVHSHILQDLDQEQEESLIVAVVLSERKSHLALTRLGDVYYWRGKGDLLDPSTQDKDLLDKAEKLFLEAYEINPESPVLLKRLAKALLFIDRKKYESFAEDCLLKAHEIEPLNSMILHRLGQFYEYATDSVRDLAKAGKYYTEAINSGPTRNVLAQIDLGRIKRKQDRNFDGVEYLRNLLKNYTLGEEQIMIKMRLEKLENSIEANRLFRNLRW